MKRAIFFVLLTVVSLLSFAQNLVINPGFETWEKSNKPAGWTTAQNCLKDSDNIKSGSYSCRQDGGTKYLGQSLSIVPGKRYMLSFFYKTVITGSGNGCRTWCYWKDAEGNNLTDVSTDDILRPSKYLKSDRWQQFSVDLAAPACASSFYIEIKNNKNCFFFFSFFGFKKNFNIFFKKKKIKKKKNFPSPPNYLLKI